MAFHLSLIEVVDRRSSKLRHPWSKMRYLCLYILYKIPIPHSTYHWLMLLIKAEIYNDIRFVSKMDTTGVRYWNRIPKCLVNIHRLVTNFIYDVMWHHRTIFLLSKNVFFSIYRKSIKRHIWRHRCQLMGDYVIKNCLGSIWLNRSSFSVYVRLYVLCR